MCAWNTPGLSHQPSHCRFCYIIILYRFSHLPRLAYQAGCLPEFPLIRSAGGCRVVLTAWNGLDDGSFRSHQDALLVSSWRIAMLRQGHSHSLGCFLANSFGPFSTHPQQGFETPLAPLHVNWSIAITHYSACWYMWRRWAIFKHRTSMNLQT